MYRNVQVPSGCTNKREEAITKDEVDGEDIDEEFAHYYHYHCRYRYRLAPDVRIPRPFPKDFWAVGPYSLVYETSMC